MKSLPIAPGSSLPWLALLLGVCAAWNIGIDCAVPLAAFAAVAGLTLRPGQAAGAAVGVWAIDEMAQHLWLRAPVNQAAYSWAIAMLAIGLACTLAAGAIARRAQWPLPRAVVSLVVAFGVYEGAMYLAARFWLGGTQFFGPGLLAKAAAVNCAGLAAILALRAILAAGGKEAQLAWVTAG